MRLLRRSLQLDLDFFSLSLPFMTKLRFILVKYRVILAEFFRTIFFSRRKAYILGQDYYYDDRYGLAVLQGTFIDNAFLKKFIPEDGVIIDVGANIGQFNLFCRHYLRAKRIYSFEPVEETFSYLKKNCVKNVYHAAVSTKRSLKMYIASLSVWSSAYLDNPTDKVEIVPTVKLDALSPLEKETAISLLKIDTEGTELDVLRASRKILKKSQYILIEIQFTHLADSSLPEILSFLRNEIKDIKIVRIGRVYNSEIDGTTGSADMLFYNPTVSLP